MTTKKKTHGPMKRGDRICFYEGKGRLLEATVKRIKGGEAHLVDAGFVMAIDGNPRMRGFMPLRDDHPPVVVPVDIDYVVVKNLG
jgi:hypothetical protein